MLRIRTDAKQMCGIFKGKENIIDAVIFEANMKACAELGLREWEGMELDPQLLELQELIPELEPLSVAELRLRAATVKFNRKAIERELNNVAKVVADGGRAFCILSVENAEKALADIQREENRLKKVSRVDTHPSRSRRHSNSIHRSLHLRLPSGRFRRRQE